MTNIIPSQMEVAPLHCTVDISQKRRLFRTQKRLKRCKRDSWASIVGVPNVGLYIVLAKAGK